MKLHADSNSVKIRHVDSGILPCVGTTSLKKVVYMATNAISDMSKNSNKCRRAASSSVAFWLKSYLGPSEWQYHPRVSQFPFWSLRPCVYTCLFQAVLCPLASFRTRVLSMHLTDRYQTHPYSSLRRILVLLTALVPTSMGMCTRPWSHNECETRCSSCTVCTIQRADGADSHHHGLDVSNGITRHNCTWRIGR